MVLQVGKAGGLCLKQEGEFTKVITDQNIQPAIHVEVVHCYAFPGLLWHIVSLLWLYGRKRPANTFLAPPCVVYDVCIKPWPIQVLTGVLLDFCGREVALVKPFNILLMKARWNYDSMTHQQQSLICRELVSEVPVCPGHSQSMPSLVWPSLLSKLVNCAQNGVFPHCIFEFGNPGLVEGNVINSHIQFYFPSSS